MVEALAGVAMPALVILLGKYPRHHDLVSASLALLLSYHLTIVISRDRSHRDAM
jgi:hypothetical protein